MAPLVEPVHDAFGRARLYVDKLGVPNTDEKRWLRTSLFRSDVFDYLAAHAVADWSLDHRSHHLNGTVHLAHTHGDLKLRILREAPIRGGVPCAGVSGRRQAYYRNRPYGQLGLWGAPKDADHNLLLLWNELAEDVSLRLVHPIGVGTALRGVPIDLSADLPRHRAEFENRRFDVLDEDLDDTVSYDDEEGGSGGSA
ncbi:hypothetical protein CIW51_17215 [Mycolicibacterium sp. P9-22]|nr:hypothetical protein CIW51_17215 [Mycolicibacterium sp. P9-22]